MRDSLLFTAGRIGPMEVRNRIAFPAYHLGYAEDGCPEARTIGFYERLARGGVGMITVGVCNTIEEPDARLAGALGFGRDECIDRFAELAERAQRRGAKIGAQLSPLGSYNSPRHVPAPADIERIIESFGEAAARVARAGLDFVELMLSGGSLLSHFLSPEHNTWEIPGYSGQWDERLRAPLEALAAVRAAVGADYPVLARIHGHEFLERGYGNDGARRIARALEGAGIDGINVTGGGHRTTLPQLTSHVPSGAFAFLARGVRGSVRVPLLFGGRVRTPREAIRVREQSGADFVNVARALVVDPDWPSKAAEGRESEIVPCMACGHCFDRVFSSTPVRCSLNSNVGRATVRDAPSDAGAGASPGRAVVVGSGPGGLQAAGELAGAGYRVTLVERGEVLGGRWRLAARLHGREDLVPALSAFIQRVHRHGVEVRLGFEATPENLAGLKPDLVVLATGATLREVSIEGLDRHPNVIPVDRVPEEMDRVGSEVAVIGAGGAGVEVAIHLKAEGTPGLETLGFLARYGRSEWLQEALAFDNGRRVTLLRRRGFAGKGLGRSVRWTMLGDLERLGARIVDRCEYRAVTPKGLRIFNRRDEAEELIPADTLILAPGYEPRSGLLDAFESVAPRVVLVGDADHVANIGEAVGAGARLI